MRKNEESESKLEETLFNNMMRKAALACYAVGIFAIVSSVVQSVLSSLVLSPISSGISSGVFDPTTIVQVTQYLDSILPLTIITLTITLLLTIVFALYTYRVGQAYKIGTVKMAGPSYVLMQLATIPLLLAAYQLVPMLPLISSNPSAVASQLLGIALLILVAGLATFAFLLLFIITFILGLVAMGTQTGIALFRTAMWLAIAGIVLSFLNSSISSAGVPIDVGGVILDFSIIAYGLALSRAGKEGMMPEQLKQRLDTQQT